MTATNPAPARKVQQSRSLSGFLAGFGLTRYVTRQQYYSVRQACVTPSRTKTSSSAESVGKIYRYCHEQLHLSQLEAVS